MARRSAEVLVVGAGPTGLSLALQLAASGVRARVVDRGEDRVRESRALVVQPRTLEVLAGLGVTDDLLACGNRGVRVCIHVRGRELRLPLFDFGMADTAYPFLLFLSQAETERILAEHLAAAGVVVERGAELVELTGTESGALASLRHGDGRMERLAADYVAGCDGAHSAVRELAGIAFEGGSYPQTFILADLEADGIEPGAAHVFLAPEGFMFFFPLLRPASWRLLAMRPPGDPVSPEAPVTLDRLAALADAYTGGQVRPRDPVWMTGFRLHHRLAARYRAGRILLAGDAAHIHSPAGGQGMNTGIQDAVNLGWKLAQTLTGTAAPAILDTYDLERAPVGRRVLRMSDRAFTVATSAHPAIRIARTRLAPVLLPRALKSASGRARAFRTVSQLAISYRRSPLSTEGASPPKHGPRAGDRLPDAPLVYDGRPTSLHALTAPARWHLLLCGLPEGRADGLAARHGELVAVLHLRAHGPSAVRDQHQLALSRLGLAPREAAHYLVRPDGHIAYRAGGADLTGLARYLERWLRPPG